LRAGISSAGRRIALEGMRLIQTYCRAPATTAGISRPDHACWRRPAWGRRRSRRDWAPCTRSRTRRRAFQYPSRAHQRDRAAVRAGAQPAAIEARLQVIARTLDLPGEPYRAVFDWVLAFRQRLRIPHSLAEIGVAHDKHEIIGHEASLDPSASGNPLPTDATTYGRLFRSAVKGDLTLAG